MSIIVSLSKENSGHIGGEETNPNRTEIKGITIIKEKSEKKTYRILNITFRITSFL
jgi:hypothetical protein